MSTDAQSAGPRTVVITGAAGGVGAVAVGRFVDEGARVVAVDHNAEGLATLADEHDVEIVPADVSDPDDVRRVVAVAGDVDVMVNNAAVIDRLGRVHEADLEEWNRLLAVNLTGPFLFCHEVLPGMIERGCGVIVNVASVAGLRGGRAGAAYTASKHGLVGMTLNIAATLGDSGIRSNVVCPGSIRTNMQTVPGDFPEAIATITRDSRKPPSASPGEIAEAITFLASERASRINGVALPVDGGYLAF